MPCIPSACLNAQAGAEEGGPVKDTWCAGSERLQRHEHAKEEGNRSAGEMRRHAKKEWRWGGRRRQASTRAHHVRSVDGGLQRFVRLLGCLLAQLGVAACACATRAGRLTRVSGRWVPEFDSTGSRGAPQTRPGCKTAAFSCEAREKSVRRLGTTSQAPACFCSSESISRQPRWGLGQTASLS
jgi:hypothetical protein